jgi:hypothetical protein
MDNESHLHPMFNKKKHEDDALISVCTLYQTDKRMSCLLSAYQRPFAWMEKVNHGILLTLLCKTNPPSLDSHFHSTSSCFIHTFRPRTYLKQGTVFRSWPWLKPPILQE